MGQCLATLLQGNCEVTICSRDVRKAAKIASRYGCCASNLGDCSDQEIAILAVPTGALVETAGSIAGIMPVGSLVMDISSVKCGVIDKVQKATAGRVNYVSIHPLFNTPRARTKNTLLVPVNPGSWVPPLTDLLEKSGMRVTEVQAEEHDRIMAAVQVTHHFALLSLNSSLYEMGYPDRRSLDPYLTNSLAKTLRTIESLDRNGDTISMIQKCNPFARFARKKFMEKALELDRRLSAH
ncbi:MAG: prephenate dehydrogenase/arogenate dehydrogenase family protein [Candidatus Methanomethylicus sp.]|nr:prephenate dehydrogenase/arogenate dehydrogenase family protein [Candidatus Methanomethylicus sp.]